MLHRGKAESASSGTPDRKSQVRAELEHPFLVLERLWSFAKLAEGDESATGGLLHLEFQRQTGILRRIIDESR
jgi:hypothetical protein